MNAEPSLLLVAHGSRDPRAEATCRAIRDRVAAAKPAAVVAVSYLEHTAPSPADAIAGFPDGPVALVPLLLATAYHVRVDIECVARDARAAGREIRVARALLPDPRLLDTADDRLAEAGVVPTAAIVLASAGTTDEMANATTRTVAAALSARRGRPVVAAFASAAEPSVPQALSGLQVTYDDVAVLTFMLSPGAFADAIADAAHAAAVPVTAVLGEHPAVAATVLSRFDDAVNAGLAGE